MRSALLLALLAWPAHADEVWRPAEGGELIGTHAPEWRGLTWIQGGPLSVAKLSGKVILLRFWSDACPYCERTISALETLGERLRGRPLMVVGIHHPKTQEGRDPASVLRAARRLGFTFPVATDTNWETIHAYGVEEHFHRFTSVAFLIDQAGVIRWVHDGGEFHEGGGPEHRECNRAYESLVKAIDRVVAEKR